MLATVKPKLDKSWQGLWNWNWNWNCKDLHAVVQIPFLSSFFGCGGVLLLIPDTLWFLPVALCFWEPHIDKKMNTFLTWYESVFSWSRGEALAHYSPWPGWSCVLELEEKKAATLSNWLDGSCLCIDEGFHPIEVVRNLLAAQLTEYPLFQK